MVVYYCPVCRKTLECEDISAEREATKHFFEHNEEVRDIITISPRSWLRERLREERYWDERWLDDK